MPQHIQMPSGHYRNNYDTKDRFASYWHQIDSINKFSPTSILEVGIGGGFLSSYLQRQGVSITTLDLDPDLSPSILGSVLDIPCQSNSFDIVTSFQVLEHLPYECFLPALKEICRVSRLHAVISLPDGTRTLRLLLKIPGVKETRMMVSLPLLPKRHVFDGQHYWEVGRIGYPLRRITQDMHSAGFVLENTFQVFEKPFHRFFELHKQSTVQ